MWIASDSSAIVEMVGHLGFYWLLIDLEHGLGGEAALLQQLQALRATPTRAVVRVVNNDAGQIKRALDMGAAGIMVPFVSTAEEARQAVAAIQYPPLGRRGVAGSIPANRYALDFQQYFPEANDNVLAVVQIETPQAVANVDEIAQVDGVDVVFAGPMDLSVNLGIAEQFEHPRLREGLAGIVEACRRHQKIPGIFLPRMGMAPTAAADGFSFMAIGTEMDLLRDHLLSIRADLAGFRR